MDANVKRAAAEFAVNFVQSGMVVGLGFGSTAIHATRRIGHLLQRGKLHDVLGVPCSLQTEHDAQVLGIPLTTLDDHPVVDLTIDGADEVDPHFNLIKGGGGALLREKIVAQATKRQVIVVDASKLSPALGTHWAVPIEVIRFNWHAQLRWLESLGAQVTARKRKNGELFLTDQGNLILDANFGAIANPSGLAHTLSGHAGIVEHGLFIGLTHDVVIADANGVRHVEVFPPQSPARRASLLSLTVYGRAFMERGGRNECEEQARDIRHKVVVQRIMNARAQLGSSRAKPVGLFFEEKTKWIA